MYKKISTRFPSLLLAAISILCAPQGYAINATWVWSSTGPGDGSSYSDGGNWDLGGVDIPCNTLTNSYDVFIDDILAFGDYYVVQDTGYCEVDSLTLGPQEIFYVDPGNDFAALNSADIAGSIEVGTAGGSAVSFIADSNAVFSGDNTSVFATDGGIASIGAPSYSSVARWGIDCDPVSSDCWPKLFRAESGQIHLDGLLIFDASFDDGDPLISTNIQEVWATAGGAIYMPALHTIKAPVQPDDKLEFKLDAGSRIDLSGLRNIKASGPSLALSGWVYFDMTGGGELWLGSLGNEDFTGTDIPATAMFDLGPAGVMVVAPGSLNLASSVMYMGAAGAQMSVGQDFAFHHTDEGILQLDATVVRFEGSGTQHLEVGGADLGSGLSAPLNMNFGFGQLIVGVDGASTTVQFQDAINNATSAGNEALYLFGTTTSTFGLDVAPGSTLVLNGVNLYMRNSSASPWVHVNSLFPANVYEINDPYCPNPDDPFNPTNCGRIKLSAAPDTDGDGVPDDLDNCTLVSNGPLTSGISSSNIQRDTNGDGFGNICDADLNNDVMVSNIDFSLFKQAYGTSGAGLDADFNGDGVVSNIDFSLFKQMYGKPPGPSGLSP